MSCCLTQPTYKGQILWCWVTGKALRARSKTLRHLVTLDNPTEIRKEIRLETDKYTFNWGLNAGLILCQLGQIDSLPESYF